MEAMSSGGIVRMATWMARYVEPHTTYRMHSATRTAPAAEPSIRPRPGRDRTASRRRRIARPLFEGEPMIQYTNAPRPPILPGPRRPHDDGKLPPVYCLVGRSRPFFSTVMTKSAKTFSPRPRDIERRWYVVDADGAVLGRLASEVAKVLRGKHKPIFAPHVDTGDHVIIVNADKIVLTAGKAEKKLVYRHSGYPGGLRETVYSRLLSERPVYVVEKAIRGMLPKNRLGRAMIRKLQVYEGPEHPHEAQKPQPLALGQVPAWEGLPKR